MNTNSVTEIKVTRRTRRLGFGYSTVPTGDGTEIADPAVPQVEGTVRQVLESVRADRILRSIRSGGVFVNTGWFYRGRPIVSVSHNSYAVYPDQFTSLFADLLDGDLDDLIVGVSDPIEQGST